MKRSSSNALVLATTAVLLLLLNGAAAASSSDSSSSSVDKPASLAASTKTKNGAFFAFGPPTLTGLAAAALEAPKETVTGSIVNKVDTILAAKYDPVTVSAWRRLLTGKADISATAGPALSGAIKCFVGPTGTVVGLRYGSAQVCETSDRVVDVHIGTGYVSNIKVILSTPNATIGGLEFVVTTGKTSASTFCGRMLGLSAWIGKPGKGVGAIGGTCTAPTTTPSRRRRGRSILEEEDKGVEKEEENSAADAPSAPVADNDNNKNNDNNEPARPPLPPLHHDAAAAAAQPPLPPLPAPPLPARPEHHHPPHHPGERGGMAPAPATAEDDAAIAAAAASPGVAAVIAAAAAPPAPLVDAAATNKPRRRRLAQANNGTSTTGGLSAGTLQVVLVPAPVGENNSGSYGNGTVFGG